MGQARRLGSTRNVFSQLKLGGSSERHLRPHSPLFLRHERLRIVGGVAVFLIAAAAAWLFQTTKTTPQTTATAEPPTLSIAILPFVAPADEQLAATLMPEITAAFWRNARSVRLPRNRCGRFRLRRRWNGFRLRRQMLDGRGRGRRRDGGDAGGEQLAETLRPSRGGGCRRTGGARVDCRLVDSCSEVEMSKSRVFTEFWAFLSRH